MSAPRPLPVRRTLRAAVGALATFAALSAGLLAAAAAPAAAQTVSVGFAPGCGPGTVCGLLHFTITAGSDALLLDALTLSAAPGSHTFQHIGGVGQYFAGDDVADFSGATTVTAGGTQLFIDFLDPFDIPFTLAAGNVGHVEVAVADQDAALPLAFTFTGALTGGGTITRVVSTNVVPEPATVLLVASGLAGVGLVARRRRVA